MTGLVKTSNPGTSGLSRTNYARIGHAAQNVLPKFLQKILATQVSQSQLHSKVSANSYLQINLRPHEWSKINNARKNGYGNFDIPLIYKLMCNLKTTVKPHTKGWGRGFPTTTEITTGDDIERIRRTRNEIIHRGNTEVSDIELASYFALFKDIARRLDQCVGQTTNEFVNDICDLESCSMDERKEQSYIEDLEILKKREEDLSDAVTKVQENVETLQANVNELQGNVAAMQEDISKVQDADVQTNELEKWEDQNARFVKTEAVDAIVNALKEKHVVCVCGNSGIGKSVTVHHVALYLRDNNKYQVFQCFSPSEISQNYKKNKLQAFVFDDVCGKYTLIQNDVEDWIKRTDSIRNCIMHGKVKILVTCRSQVFHEEQFQRIKLLTDESYNLSSKQFTLPYDIKLLIAKQYLPDDIVDCIKSEINEFELLPLIFPWFKTWQHKLKNVDYRAFFRNPFKIYEEELDQLNKAYNKEKMCALFYLVVNNGFIDERIFDNEDNTDEVWKGNDSFFEECGVNRGTPLKHIRSQLDSLLHFFVKKSRFYPRSGYTAIHDKMFDFLCFFFGKNFQKAFIRYVNTNVLNERTSFKWSNNNGKEFNIIIDEENEKQYWERVVKDLSLGMMQTMLDNDQIKHKTYRVNLANYIQNLDAERKKKLISLTDKDGFSLIHFASKLGEISLLTFLIKNGADINAGMHIRTPIEEVCLSYGTFDNDKQDWYNIVKLLIEKGANVNTVNRYSPLTLACQNVELCLVKLLLKSGADINPACSDLDESPLVAVFSDPFQDDNCKLSPEQYRIIKLLLDNGANVKAVDKHGDSPLTKACQHGDFKLVNLLVRRGARVNPYKKHRSKPLRYPLIETFNKDLTYSEGTSQDQYKIVKLLLDNGAKVNKNGSFDQSPLTYACLSSNFNLVKLLLERGAFANIDYNSDNDSENLYPLIAVCYSFSFDDTKKQSQVQYEIVKLLLNHGANLNIIDDNGWDPLFNACIFGKIDIVRLLLEQGASVNSDDDFENSIIYDVCSRFKLNDEKKQKLVEIVELLLDKRANINNAPIFGDSPLLIACKRGHFYLAKLLIERGAHIQNEDFTINPMTTACESNSNKLPKERFKIIELLLDKGVSINIIDNDGDSPLTIACRQGDIDFVSFLIKKGADVNPDIKGKKQLPLTVTVFERSDKLSQDRYKIIHLLLDKGANVNIVNGYGYSPLTIACLHGDLTLVKVLLERGADVHSNNESLHQLPLTAAVTTNTYLSQDRYKIIGILLGKGANVNIVDKNGYSPLIKACYQGDITLVRFLLTQEADVNPDNDNLNESPLTAVANTWIDDKLSQDRYKIIELLLDKDANINTVNKNGDSLLTKACEMCDFTFVQDLIAKGADVKKISDDFLQTLLIRACPKQYCFRLQDRYKIVEFLLDIGANLNKIDKYGNFPLTTSCRLGKFDFVRFLIKKGADVNPGNDHHFQTPLSAACKYDSFDNNLSEDHYKIVKLILKKGAIVNTVDSNGYSILVNACCRGDITLVRLLLKKGVDVDLDNKHLEQNPLNAVFDNKYTARDCKTHSQNRYKIIKTLVSKGATVNIANKNGDLPLTKACLQGKFKSVICLVEGGADVNPKNFKQTPLTAAAESSSPHRYKIIEFLLNKGANIDNVDKYGDSLLPILCRQGDITLLRYIIKKGAHINPKNSSQTQVMAAVKTSSKENSVRCLKDLTPSQITSVLCFVKKELKKESSEETKQHRSLEIISIPTTRKRKSSEDADFVPKRKKEEHC